MTQNGGLNLTDDTGVGVNFNTNGYMYLEATGANGVNVLGTQGVFIDGYSGGVEIAAATLLDIVLGGSATVYFQIGAANALEIIGYQVGVSQKFKIGFNGVTPVAQPSSGGTLAGLIAALVSLGLISS